MLYRIITSACLILFSASGQAQPCTTQLAHQHGKMHHKMRQQQQSMQALDLSASQQEEIKKIKTDTRKSMDAMRSDASMTLGAFDQKKAELLKIQKSKIQNLLTPEQKAKQEQLKKEKESKAQARFAEQLNRQKEKLNLKEDQVKQIQQLHDRSWNEAKAIRNNDDMGPQAKKDAMKKIREASDAERKKIYSPEQWKQWEEMQKNRHDHHPKGPHHGPKPMAA